MISGLRKHDIRTLIALAIPFEASFSSWMAEAERLTPYAVRFRYPDDILEPDEEEFEQALKADDGLYTFVLSLLPEATQPASG